MKQATQLINSTQLRQFAPLGKLSDDDAQELLRTAITINLSPGTPLFSNDDSGDQLFYLIKGKIELHSAGKTSIIESGTNEARKPISRHSDKQASASAVEQSTLISFDADMLELFLNWTNPNAYVVSEIDSSKDHEWLNRLLKSRGLSRFSEQQINTLLGRMNEIHFNKGDVVISQDDNDEFYYVIKNGSATVSRKPSAGSKEIKLAELGEGDAFGEESILTHSNRNATITMNESGDLMRLSKNDFSEFLAQPLLETVSLDEAQAMVTTGAEFIDIRLEDEFNELHIPDSRNIPLPLLRLKLKQLSQQRKYIICCDDGSRSTVAAFLLNRNGFNAYILDGGMTTVISQMADEQMNKIAAETEMPISEADIKTNEHGNQFCSLAEHWGDAVKQFDENGFSDNEELHKVEKTSVTDGTKKNISTYTYMPVKQKPVTIDRRVSQERIQPKTSNFLRYVFFGLIIVAVAVSFNYFTANTNGINKQANTAQSPATEKSMQQFETPVKDFGSSTMIVTPEPITPMTRFVEPTVENTANEATTELVGDVDAQLTDSEINQLESTINTSQPKQAPPVAVDPATRGFIE